MGYAFSLAFCKILLHDVPTGAYVHYPTISTDMLSSLDPTSTTGTQGVNAGKGRGAAGAGKKIYWELFAKLYSVVGTSIDEVMTNSSWTLGHINSLWGSWRNEYHKSSPRVVYPPVAVEELEKEVEISEASEKKRENVLLYIAQFRPGQCSIFHQAVVTRKLVSRYWEFLHSQCLGIVRTLGIEAIANTE